MKVPPQKRRSASPRRRNVPHHPKDSLGGLSALFVQNRLSAKILYIVAMVLTVMAVVVYYPVDISDNDIWWHLKYGQESVEQGTWKIDHSPYSWTPADNNWNYVTWIGSALLYLMFSLGQYPALVAFRGFVFLLMIVLFVSFTRISKIRLNLFHLAEILLLMIALNPKAITIKPELFSLLFFTVAVYLYFVFKSTSRHLFLFYPLLFLVWVNTHGVFSLGLVFIGAAAVGETANYLFHKKSGISRRSLMLLITSVLLSCSAILVNPYGASYPAGILRNFFAGGQERYLTVLENLSLRLFLPLSNYPQTFRVTNTAWLMIVMLLTILLVMVVAYRRHHTVDFGILGVNLLFFFLGFSAIRISAYFPIIWLFSLAYMASKYRLDIKRAVPPLSFVLILCVGMLSIAETLRYTPSLEYTGTNDESRVPVREAAFLVNHHLPGPLFHNYTTGAYLIWAVYPRYKVFIDPRYRPYLATGVWEDYTIFFYSPDQAHLNALTDKYPFNTIIMNHRSKPEFVQFLVYSPDWQLVYFDRVAAVFVRSEQVSGIENLNESTLAENADTKRFEDCDNPSVLASIFNMYYWSGAYNEAEEILTLYDQNVRAFFFNRERNLMEMRQLLAAARSR
ncbi:hypothetical protein ACFL5H_01450 [Candidatus Latescibacterota bacterium]